MRLNKEQLKIVDLLTGKHVLIVKELSNDYSNQRGLFLRDIYHSINDDFPELELSNLDLTKEEVGLAIVAISNNHVIDESLNV